MIAYEQMLKGDPLAALREGSMHFERESAVHKTLLRITQRLDVLGIPYAIAGGMALFFYGYRRFTEDVDVLVTPEGLAKLHEELEGRGYVPPFAGSRNLRDAETGVRIDFIVTGNYPGDGAPKAIAFPHPNEAQVEIAGIAFVGLEKLIELKLASGSAPGRRRDLADVQELIRVRALPRHLSAKLDGSLRAQYEQLWDETAQTPPES